LDGVRVPAPADGFDGASGEAVDKSLLHLLGPFLLA
jgi:hypothetical protein